MAAARSRWGSFAVLVAGTAALTFLLGAVIDQDGTVVSGAGAITVGSLAVAALAWARYRGGRDPRDLYLSAAFAVFAAQGAIFGVGWALAHNRSTYFVGTSEGAAYVRAVGAAPVAAYAWQVGLILGGSLLLLGSPWTDRRGRAPVRAIAVFGAGALMLVTADLLLWLGYRDPADGLRNAAGGADLGALGWGFAAVGATVMLVAAARTWGAPFGARPSRPWLTVAFVLAASLAVAIAVLADAGTPFLLPADLVAAAVPGLVFVGLLVDQRTDSSRARRTTDRADEILGGRAEIASMIAHEVRGPAATVRGIASTSLTHYDRLSDEERREFLGMIETESRRLMTTVDQMSLALKVDAGSLRFDLMPQNLEGIVLAGVEAVGAADRRIDVQAEAGIMISADRTRMIEVIRQLVDNAVKYSPADRPIRVHTRRDGTDVAIEVVDEGPGIPAAEREHVFEKFPNWRPPGYEEQPGTGLGLFICRGLLAEHSGEISIGDGPGGGTMLRVRLPVEG